MYFDINGIIEKELSDICAMLKNIELSMQSKPVVGGNRMDNNGNEDTASIYKSSTSEGLVYYKRYMRNGKLHSYKLGGADNEEVIRIKQAKFDKEMLRVLKIDRALLQKVAGKFIPYDPDAIDETLKPVYRDKTGLVNKAPGNVDMKVWDRIIKKNGYQMSDKPNIAPDGMETRSKSEIIVYGILKGYGLAVKYDFEIALMDETGHEVAVSPDFIILCNDGRLIIIEHLGLMDDIQYLDKKIKRIHLYQINGYKLNDNLFLTSDYAKGKIDARVIDELVQEMILPRVK